MTQTGITFFRDFSAPEPEPQPGWLVVWRESDVVDGYVKPLYVAPMSEGVDIRLSADLSL